MGAATTAHATDCIGIQRNELILVGARPDGSNFRAVGNGAMLEPRDGPVPAETIRRWAHAHFFFVERLRGSFRQSLEKRFALAGAD
jgi:hypothetical protein